MIECVSRSKTMEEAIREGRRCYKIREGRRDYKIREESRRGENRL